MISHTRKIAGAAWTLLRDVVLCSLLLLTAASIYSTKLAAAELQEVTNFGGVPGAARMFIYVPEQLAASPALLVAIHYCTGSAQAYFTGTSFRGQADRHGFIVIYPETTASDRCFDVHSEATLKHDGGGDSGAIAAMVRYALREHKADPKRVYVAGTSSGAMMTNVMVGAYPELFRAGAAFAGVPFACFAGGERWNGDCAEGRITKTGQAWGELVRNAYPGYSGPRPRMQLWHGDQDETLRFPNFGEEIKQWTNVLGVSETPTSTEQDAPRAGWVRTRYTDSAGVVRVEAMVGTGMPHNLAVLTDEAVHFFGLDADRDPTDAAVSGTAGAGGSASGAGGAASVTGSAGGSGVAAANAACADAAGATAASATDVKGRTRVSQWCFAATSTVGSTLQCIDVLDIFDPNKEAPKLHTEVRKLAGRWLEGVERHLRGSEWIARPFLRRDTEPTSDAGTHAERAQTAGGSRADARHYRRAE